MVDILRVVRPRGELLDVAVVDADAVEAPQASHATSAPDHSAIAEKAVAIDEECAGPQPRSGTEG
jgi:hypothetical protein